MTLLSGKNHTGSLPLSIFYVDVYDERLTRTLYSDNLSFPVITQNQINSGGYYINDAGTEFGQLMVCALIQVQIQQNRLTLRCGMCNLSFLISPARIAG